jgi:hypothetical protein
MSTTMDLFGGIEARDAGIMQAAECRNELVNKVRFQLAYIARNRADRCATIDDAVPFLEAIGLSASDLGNAAGSIFKTDAWEFSGHWLPSKRKSNHARPVRVWRLKIEVVR